VEDGPEPVPGVSEAEAAAAWPLLDDDDAEAPEPAGPSLPRTLEHASAEPLPEGWRPWRWPWPEGTEALWRCEIVWDAGYRSSRFRAVVLKPGRFHRPQPITASEEFRWLLKEDPETTDPQYVEAVRAMTQELVDAGWEPTERGSRWWSRRFVSHGDEPPAVASSKPAP
jgi:hypothetical protein